MGANDAERNILMINGFDVCCLNMIVTLSFKIYHDEHYCEYHCTNANIFVLQKYRLQKQQEWNDEISILESNFSLDNAT